jgi:hypothetical protein
VKPLPPGKTSHGSAGIARRSACRHGISTVQYDTTHQVTMPRTEANARSQTGRAISKHQNNVTT